MLHLRAIEPEDLDLMYVIENDVQLWKHGLTTTPFSRYTLRQYIEQSQNDIYKDGQVRFAILDDNGNTCGFLDITDFVPQHSRAQVGIVVIPEAQRLGLAARALAEATGYARQTGIHQLYAVVAESNPPANALFSKAGYTRTAHLSDWLKTPEGYSPAHLYTLLLS